MSGTGVFYLILLFVVLALFFLSNYMVGEKKVEKRREITEKIRKADVGVHNRYQNRQDIIREKLDTLDKERIREANWLYRNNKLSTGKTYWNYRDAKDAYDMLSNKYSQLENDIRMGTPELKSDSEVYDGMQIPEPVSGGMIFGAIAVIAMFTAVCLTANSVVQVFLSKLGTLPPGSPEEVKSIWIWICIVLVSLIVIAGLIKKLTSRSLLVTLTAFFLLGYTVPIMVMSWDCAAGDFCKITDGTITIQVVGIWSLSIIVSMLLGYLLFFWIKRFDK